MADGIMYSEINNIVKIIIPPFPYLESIYSKIRETESVFLGAQNCHQKTEGAKLTPPLRTDGVVDDATYASIMAIQPPPFELSAAKKSKGDDVTLIQKQLGAKVGTFTIDTENAVKKFQTDFGTKVTPPLRTDGVVDIDTFNLIKRYKGPNSRKVFSF